MQLDFPEVQNINISENTFNQIIYDRKSSKYRNSIEIARLLLLNYHPDIKVGTNDVLALMFDMNYLWERFVYASLRKHNKKGNTITAQNTRNFWKPIGGRNSKMKPDIVINKDKGDCVVLDTKWKNLKLSNPSPHDLRQMYVYMKYYNASRVALVYPNIESAVKSGTFYNESISELSNRTLCKTERVWV